MLQPAIYLYLGIYIMYIHSHGGMWELKNSKRQAM